MKISASINSRLQEHVIEVKTNDISKEIMIPVKNSGYGSSVNGGELLLLALATCFCNDIYREAAKKNISVSGVEVDFTAEFGGDGEPGANFKYTAKVISEAPQEVIDN